MNKDTEWVRQEQDVWTRGGETPSPVARKPVQRLIVLRNCEEFGSENGVAGGEGQWDDVDDVQDGRSRQCRAWEARGSRAVANSETSKWALAEEQVTLVKSIIQEQVRRPVRRLLPCSENPGDRYGG